MGTRTTTGAGLQRRTDRIGGRCRVLLVEPRDTDAQQVFLLLSDIERFTVVRARTIDEGFASKASHRPDVVLIDLTGHRPGSKRVLDAVSSFAEDTAVIGLVTRSDSFLAHDALRRDAQECVFKDTVEEEVLHLTIRYARERFRLLRVQHRTEGRFRRLVNDIPDAAMVVDMQGELLHLNPPATELFPSLKGGDPLAKVGIHVPAPQSETITLDDQRLVEVRNSRIEWQNRPAWLVLLRDASLVSQVADLKARLSHAEKLAVIGELAAGVAHEINNPLAFILANLSAALGHAHQLQDIVGAVRDAAHEDGGIEAVQAQLEHASPDLFTELREILEDNLDGVDRIRTIVRELRTFSRRESEERELVRVHDMVKSACHMLGGMIRHRAALIKDLQPVPPVLGHPVKLTQIMTNLLMNAAQALPAHRGREERIEVRTVQEDRWVVITVSDTGTGIDDSVRTRIFEPFFTTKTGESGTGIGLSLSAELARQHDGDLRLVETSPEGSAFELRLPVADTVRLVRPPEPSTSGPAGDRSTRRRILLVDDEPNVRKSMMRMLRAYDVVSASNGREALALIEEEAFDVVICDLVMPDLDGVDVHEALTLARSSILGRIIYTSGGAYTPRTASFVAKNDILFVEKPVHPKRLMQMIEEVLQLD